VFQLLVNVGMIAGMMPVTGIPLPFITHGGASLVSTAIALGLLQSIAMRSDQPRPSW
jgi:rod shape determining protein RodA